jgi:hypothetical protein
MWVVSALEIKKKSHRDDIIILPDNSGFEYLMKMKQKLFTSVFIETQLNENSSSWRNRFNRNSFVEARGW